MGSAVNVDDNSGADVGGRTSCQNYHGVGRTDTLKTLGGQIPSCQGLNNVVFLIRVGHRMRKGSYSR